MTDDELREFFSAKRMRVFTTANHDLLKTNPKYVSLLPLLDEDFEVLEASGAAGVSAAGVRSDGTNDKKTALTALTTLVRKIVKTAKAIKKENPVFNNKFKLKRGNLSEQEWLDVSRSFINDLPEVIDKFVEYGMSDALVNRLNNHINAFEAARVEQTSGKGGGIATTARTKSTITRLMQTRRTLALVVHNILEELGEMALLAEWESACHVERAPKRKKNEESPTT